MVKRDLVKYISIILAFVLGIWALNTWVFETVTVTNQMSNTYLKKGDRVLVNMHASLHYGDFVLYKVEDKEYVGRIIGTSGDTVRYMDNILYRNDEIVKESYLSVNTETEDFQVRSLPNSESEKIGKNQYLILNDRRSNQADSRTFGLVNRSQIIGKMTLRILPVNKIGFVETGMDEE
ncbi:signal peptidase I [Streptococcus sp. DD13]|uniref:signal peptidase I n=1 Tax=Streptococcus sp. DD13 TaxID=1777881 RepID=UPI000794E968|nr:signal peptidase I [Streptococcus sp. DD13]KXT78667.1 Signal peptidase I [Streptococcus sp. DD13]